MPEAINKNNPVKKQLSKFIVVGLGAVACDTVVYFLLIQILSHSPAKAISFLCGTVTAYIFNKHWTFGKKEKSHKEMLLFFILYVFTLFVNILVNKLSLDALSGYSFGVVSAFILATGSSTILNFIGQKWVVFK